MDKVLAENQTARRDWLPSLMIGLVALMVCPVAESLVGSGLVASRSVRFGFAIIGVFALLQSIFYVQRAPTRAKWVCGAWVTLGALVAVLDFIAAANA